LPRFEAANAQVLGISVDHVPSHIAFADSLGGLNYPLLADFNPHGSLTRAYGLWRADRGLGKRAIFVIDRQGTVQRADVYESGLPDIDELVAFVQGLG
jgi:alkyl hydroperoxide reductase subunit AhpC